MPVKIFTEIDDVGDVRERDRESYALDEQNQCAKIATDVKSHRLLDRDYYLDIARGLINGKKTDIVTGSFTSVIDTLEDIWEGGGLYNFPITAEVLNIVSDNLNDTAAGTGARTVTIQGLDLNYDEISETITLNGTINVPTINSYLRVNRVLVRTAGSQNSNIGNITATQSISSILVAQIDPTNNQTLMAIFTVANGKKAYVQELTIGSEKLTSMSIRVRNFNEVFRRVQDWALPIQSLSITFKPPKEIFGKSDLVGSVLQSGGLVSLSACLVLVDD